MRKLLLITLVAGGLVFASVPRSDAQVYFSVGFVAGYYGYYPSRYYYLYRSSALLNVARFKLSTFLRAQTQAGVTNGCLGLAPDGFPAQILSLAHYVTLFRTHAQPTLGVALKVLASPRGHRLPPLTYVLGWRTPMGSSDGRSPNRPM